MKVLYIADDGKQFNNEWACEEYERNKKISEAQSLIIGMTLDGEKVSSPPGTEEFFDEVEIIRLTNKQAVELFKKFYEEIGYCREDGVQMPGVYIFDATGEEESMFKPIENLIYDHQKQAEQLIQLKNKIENY